MTPEDPVDHRCRRALQDGRPRPDHGRPARRAARLRQRDQQGGGARSRASVSEVAGDADILLVPDLEAGNMLAKQLTFLANADAAGIVLGARVPIILTSRADNVRARMASCAVAVLLAHARGGRERARRGVDGVADAVLTINAGSSSLKFSVYRVAAGGPAGASRPRARSRASAPRRASQPRTPRANAWSSAACRTIGPPATPSSLRVLGGWLRDHFAGRPADRRRPPGRARRRRLQPPRCESMPAVMAELEALVPLAPLHQPHNLAGIRAIAGAPPGAAPGRLLRHRLPPHPSRGRRPVRPAAPVLRPGRPPLRLPRPVLRIHRRRACRRSRPASPMAGWWSPISAAAPACAPCRPAAASTAPWASPRSTACRWARAAARSTPASCSI